MHLSEMIEITFDLLVALLAGVGIGLLVNGLLIAANTRKQS